MGSIIGSGFLFLDSLWLALVLNPTVSISGKWLSNRLNIFTNDHGQPIKTSIVDVEINWSHTALLLRLFVQLYCLQVI